MKGGGDEKILYKTKDLPDTIQSLFLDSKQMHSKMNAAKALTSLQVDC